MAKWLRRSAIALGVSLTISAISSYWFYRAATTLPEDYQAVLEVAPEQQDERRKELEAQLAAVYSDATQSIADEDSDARPWSSAVTDQHINGWLATRLATEFPEAAAQGLVDPRVMFTDEGLTLAFRIERGVIEAVVRFRVAPFVTEDGRLGVELTETRVGSVPLPTGRIVEASRSVFAEAGLPLEWAEVEGRPALLVDFEQLASDARHRRTLQDIQYSQGGLFVAGQTERREPRLAVNQIEAPIQ
ncbi:hypothetical protein Pla123a_39160 [Posidoniimonas polymericola]|uniref:Uncharacterized protein n=1 Tax=Posidoniimonas polymericola TaxID=2528002 RepID=A0A5C5YE02_9BACT|nr:hypothetical protein [Posidoniimonas polymericola]TWT73580.1 hypothetical protein Pla123a_39160 [Posidoniimonas polymericola]